MGKIPRLQKKSRYKEVGKEMLEEEAPSSNRAVNPNGSYLIELKVNANVDQITLCDFRFSYTQLLVL